MQHLDRIVNPPEVRRSDPLVRARSLYTAGVTRPAALNPTLTSLRCSWSGTPAPLPRTDRPAGLCDCCPSPGAPLTCHYDLEAVRDRHGAAPWTHAAGLSAFEALLPVRPPRAGYWDDVGDTPVSCWPSLSEVFGVELLVKHEGANPSGSFKDRGLAVAVALGTACGARRFCLPTQGNAGVAAALFSARAGLDAAVVAMPEGYQGSPYHRLAELFGAEVRFGGSSIAEAGTLLRADLADELESGAIVDVSTFFEPGRLEGKKTMGLELVRDLGDGGLPDVILYPTGGGTGLVGLAKAFAECRDLGLVRDGNAPRLVAIQVDRCAPVVEAWDRGADRVDPVTSNGTIADGLDVPGAIMGHGILQAMRTTGGRAVAVAEDELLPAARLAGRHGLPVGLESAALVAAVGRLRDERFIADGERVLLLVTSGPGIAVAQQRL